MARNTSVSLGDHFTGFINERVQSGRATPSDFDAFIARKRSA